MYPYLSDCIASRRERKGGAIRALILTLSILAIIDSAHFAKAGPSTTPRETSAPADTAIAASEATQQTEEQIGLTKAKRRNVQRRLTRLGFETKVNGTFDEQTRAAISRWQEESGYPSTGFLNTGQHKALANAAKLAGKSDRKDRRRAGGHARSRGVGGPIGAIGGAVRGVGRGVGSAVGGLFR
jgi:peptidoglycan hydrolase-like protein with peptidoglycan-binding domain